MKKLFIITSVLISMPFVAFAATATVEIDTGTETINALEGILKMPKSISVSDIYTGNSALLVWIVTPTLDAKVNTISFAGLTPGGFLGRYPIFSITGEFSQSDLSRVEFDNINALKNDGLGTKVPVRLSLIPSEVIKDTTPPEPFKPAISSSPDIFGGKYFISFVAQDKGTGIKRYEYASTWFFRPGAGKWLETQSPMVLSRRMLFQEVYIRAVDKSGNYRVMSTAGPYHYASLSVGIIILLCVLLLLRRFVRLHS